MVASGPDAHDKLLLQAIEKLQDANRKLEELLQKADRLIEKAAGVEKGGNR